MTKRPVSFNMPEDMLAAIDEQAAADNRSRSQWLVQFLQRHGINPRGVKDGPYNSEVTRDGTRLVDLPERYHVTIGFTDPSLGVPWKCLELPDMWGTVERAEDVHRAATEAIRAHLGRDSVAVYVGAVST
jgi:hypothetical protein